MRLILNITLCDVSEPVVWRRMAVPMKLTFEGLHRMIQAAMGWENQHLFQFYESRETKYFRVASPYTKEFGMDASRISASNVLWAYLNQFVPDGGRRETFYYEYDYGDCWVHEIDVLELDRSQRSSAELLDGAGACPPENCGGLPGFKRMKDYLSGRMSKQEYYNWFSAADAEEFDP